MKGIGVLGVLAGLLLADGGGIRPRGSATDYPAHESADGVTIAAAAIPRGQVHKLFATDLNSGGYIVIEVAVYPDSGRDVDLHPGDFLLQTGPNSETVRAVSGRDIAAILQRKNTPPPTKSSDITIVPTATIGYESGGYDPVTGQRRSGVYTAAGVGVGVGGAGGPQVPGPAATDRDRATMERELEDKALPERRSNTAVAGYLYFPKPAGKSKTSPAQLTYYGAARQITLRLIMK